MARIFLKADWKKLIMVNYKVQPEILQKYLPAHTELDLWNGECYVSLVGFMFMNTRVKGIKIPGHVHFEEVNLRFYVKQKDKNNEWRRGVVFIKEIVPRLLIAKVANLVYHENYRCFTMRHIWSKFEGVSQYVSYDWRLGRKWNKLSVNAAIEPMPVGEGTEEEFIMEHYWGFTKVGKSKTIEYKVEHDRWNCYQIMDYAVDVNFGKLYGSDFAFLSQIKPSTVFLCQGSEVIVRNGELVK